MGDKSQRKFKRIRLIAALEIYDLATEHMLGVVQDLTTEGIGALVREPVKQGECYSLRLCLPGADAVNWSVEVSARCRWCRSSANPALQEAGFEFVEIVPDVTEAIESLIRRYQR